LAQSLLRFRLSALDMPPVTVPPTAAGWLRFVKVQRIRRQPPSSALHPCRSPVPEAHAMVASSCQIAAHSPDSALRLSYPHDPDRSPRRPTRWLRFVEVERICSIAPLISPVCTGHARVTAPRPPQAGFVSSKYSVSVVSLPHQPPLSLPRARRARQRRIRFITTTASAGRASSHRSRRLRTSDRPDFHLCRPRDRCCVSFMFLSLRV
jgi:hypothetical protein